MDKTDNCKVCDRNHTEDEPCPRRIAQALTRTSLGSFTQSEPLTSVDQRLYQEMFREEGQYEDMLERMVTQYITEGF